MNDTATLQFDLTPPTDEQFRLLAADLSDEERHVLLEHGTEAPFCGVFLTEKRPGAYTCRLCGLPLFHGGTNYDGGTGSASCTQPIAPTQSGAPLASAAVRSFAGGENRSST